LSDRSGGDPQAPGFRECSRGGSRPYVFSLVTFFGRAKKVTRLPAGTGGVEVVVFSF
jgi:hypothetical protein